MKVFTIIYFTCTLSIYLITNSNAEDPYDALIIANRNEIFELVDHAALINYDLSSRILLACPPENVEEIELNKKSVTENSLFIKGYFQSEVPKEVNHKICEKKYSPSAVKNSNTQFYELGYEVNIDEEILKDIPKPKSMKNLESVSDSWYSLRTVKREIFFWFPVMSLFFKRLLPIQTFHVVSENQYSGNFKECEDYNWNKNLITKEDIDISFDIENQFSILNQFFEPELTQEQIDEIQLVKQQLAPINDFDSYSTRVVTCTYLNVAPMWKTIAQAAWQKIENQIKKLAEIIRLEVYTGTFGVLQLPPHIFPLEPMSIFLNQIPVPEAFWKIILHSLPVKNQPTFRYAVIIVTFNHILENATHQPFCRINVCDQLGWNIKNQIYKTGYTYCCRVEKHTLAKLGISNFPEVVDLNLKALDVERDESGRIIRTINVLPKLEKMTITENV